MNRFTYLETLDRLLASLPYDERREIMEDYEAHFKEGLKDGLEEERIIESLGPPKEIAKKYLTSLVMVEKKTLNHRPINTNISNKPNNPVPSPRKGNDPLTIIILSIIALIIITVFIIPWYITLWGIVVTLVAVGISFLFVGFTLFISAIIAAPLAFFTIPVVFLQHPVLLFTSAIAIICIGGLLLIISYYFGKFLCYITYHFTNWLIKIIRGY